MANDVFPGIAVAGYSAFFTRSDERYFLQDGQECPSYKSYGPNWTHFSVCSLRM